MVTLETAASDLQNPTNLSAALIREHLMRSFHSTERKGVHQVWPIPSGVIDGVVVTPPSMANFWISKGRCSENHTHPGPLPSPPHTMSSCMDPFSLQQPTSTWIQVGAVA